ncbi:hypothetical protein EHS25_005597 [Saitozyma podzolica]|uniref:Uncharacterized protein n=1 Tax=Saitozyma podzolica TaxID=1890683 RepID=A0A427XXZ5_9TREE|nr:hypothetical protein EHS25_005597 [Saitozyma podzolica]
MARGKTIFVRRVDLLKGRLHRFKRFSWRFLVMLFSYSDISLPVGAVILGSLTVNYCDEHPDTAKILAHHQHGHLSHDRVIQRYRAPPKSIRKRSRASKAEYNQLSNGVGDMMGQIFTGSGIKSNKANQDDSKKTDKTNSAEAPIAEEPKGEGSKTAAAKD